MEQLTCIKNTNPVIIWVPSPSLFNSWVISWMVCYYHPPTPCFFCFFVCFLIIPTGIWCPTSLPWELQFLLAKSNIKASQCLTAREINVPKSGSFPREKGMSSLHRWKGTLLLPTVASCSNYISTNQPIARLRQQWYPASISSALQDGLSNMWKSSLQYPYGGLCFQADKQRCNPANCCWHKSPQQIDQRPRDSEGSKTWKLFRQIEPKTFV